jgi:hypothetical protein
VGVSWSSSRGETRAGEPRHRATGGGVATADDGDAPVLEVGASATNRRGVMAAALTGLNTARRRIPSRNDCRFFSGDVYLRRIRSLAALSGDLAKAGPAALR